MRPKLNQTIILRGKTQLGKNRVREHGNICFVVNDFSRTMPQPAMFGISSRLTGWKRNIELNDPDFEWEIAK
tara:strand:+ start:5629 stop:5844 length:216 start_codon:yes stop_codon:yes gene_type:complete